MPNNINTKNWIRASVLYDSNPLRNGLLVDLSVLQENAPKALKFDSKMLVLCLLSNRTKGETVRSNFSPTQ